MSQVAENVTEPFLNCYVIREFHLNFSVMLSYKFHAKINIQVFSHKELKIDFYSNS